jgi:hypothetical protein
VAGNLDRVLRRSCGVDGEDLAFPRLYIRCFNVADTLDGTWLTQGIAGTQEWVTPETPGGGVDYLIATWCFRANEDTCDHQTQTQTRISLAKVEFWGGRYRNVQLVTPTFRLPTGTVTLAGVNTHAGGAAVAGKYLYVAGTTKLHVFNLDHFIQVGVTSPPTYVLPVWDQFRLIESERPPLFSSISIDSSGNEPVLVGAEYDVDTDHNTLVTRWPMNPDGSLAAIGDRLKSYFDHALIDGDSEISRVQGVAVRNGTYLFSESWDSLERARVGQIRSSTDKCLEWGRGTAEDLYASQTYPLVWGINEKPYQLVLGLPPRFEERRSFWAVHRDYAFGLATPPPGFPMHHNCDED